jgi:hypothetical protein
MNRDASRAGGAAPAANGAPAPKKPENKRPVIPDSDESEDEAPLVSAVVMWAELCWLALAAWHEVEVTASLGEPGVSRARRCRPRGDSTGEGLRRTEDSSRWSLTRMHTQAKRVKAEPSASAAPVAAPVAQADSRASTPLSSDEDAPLAKVVAAPNGKGKKRSSDDSDSDEPLSVQAGSSRNGAASSKRAPAKGRASELANGSRARQASTPASAVGTEGNDDDDEDDDDDDEDEDGEDDGEDDEEEEDDEDDDASSSGSTKSKAKAKGKKPAQKGPKGRGEKKWDTLYHTGPRFPPPYEPIPDSVKLKYDGECGRCRGHAPC